MDKIMEYIKKLALVGLVFADVILFVYMILTLVGTFLIFV